MFDSTSDLNSYLTPGERVLWQGQGQRRLTSALGGGLFFLIMFVSFALFFLALFAVFSSNDRGLRNDDMLVFIILPIIFVSVGLGVGIPWMLLGRRASHARYYVTNLAALIVYAPTAGWGKRVTVVPLRNLSQLSLSENRDGTGTLTLASSPYPAYGRYSHSWALEAVPAFAHVERPLDVYQLLRKQMDELAAR